MPSLLLTVEFKRMLKLNGIRARITFGVILILILTLSPVAFMQVSEVRNLSIKRLEDKAAGIISLVGAATADSLAGQSEIKVKGLVKRACEDSEVLYCNIYGRNGRPIALSGNSPHGASEEVMEVEQSIVHGGRYLGEVKLGIFAGQVGSRTQNAVIKISLLALGIILSVAIIIRVFLDRFFVSPVVELSRQAVELGRKKFPERQDSGRYDEIGDLDRAINYASKQIRLFYSELEEKVEERTRDLQRSNLQLTDEIVERTRIQSHLSATLEELSFANQQLGKARDRAEVASRFKSQFLAMISHEIRTPMNSILGMADLLEETRLTSEQTGYVEIFRGSAELLLKIINDILDMVQIETGQVELSLSRFNPVSEVESICKGIAYAATSRSIELICDFDPNVPAEVVGDDARVRQVLENVISNAVKFTSEGEVDVRLCVESMDDDHASLLFSVRDTGVGIPEDKRNLIFESFVQVDASTSREYGGTGLGLAIAARLVGLMDGKIWFESEMDRGSTFYISIPFRTRVRAESRSEDKPLSGKNIFIVEDNNSLRAVLERRVEALGASVCSAATGEEARKSLEGWGDGDDFFDLILYDNDIPGMDTADFLEAIVQGKLFAKRMAVMISSCEGEDVKDRVLEAGAFCLLTKPVFDADLVNCINALPAALEGRQEPPVRVSVLLVEDNVDNRRIMELFIRDTGADVVSCSDGLRAAQLYSSAAFDLVFMDIELPVMDGFDAVSEIRKIESSSGRDRTPVVVISAHVLDEYKKKAFEAGSDGFLAKPARWDKVREVIRAVLTNRELPVETSVK